jgi:hypothetical protein
MTGEEVVTLASVPTDSPAPEPKGNLARDILAVFFRPAALFRELPRTNRVASALILLMVFQALYGLGLYATGVLNYEIDVETQKKISGLRQHPPAKEDAAKFASELETIEKGAIFQKEVSRVWLLAGEPIVLSVGLCVLSGMLFLVVALRGGKPNFSVLLGVTAFASYVELPRLLMRLLLIAQLHVSRVETSAAAFFSSADVGLGNYLLLRRLDPFEAWFYFLVGLGVYQSGQVKRRAAIVTACVFALMAAIAHCILDVSTFAEIGPISFGNS